MRPTDDQRATIANVARNARFVEFIRNWKNCELEALPKQQQNVPLSQGRVQVLQEFLKLLDPEAEKQPTST